MCFNFVNKENKFDKNFLNFFFFNTETKEKHTMENLYWFTLPLKSIG